jgi:hypothetical protein
MIIQVLHQGCFSTIGNLVHLFHLNKDPLQVPGTTVGVHDPLEPTSWIPHSFVVFLSRTVDRSSKRMSHLQPTQSFKPKKRPHSSEKSTLEYDARDQKGAIPSPARSSASVRSFPLGATTYGSMHPHFSPTDESAAYNSHPDRFPFSDPHVTQTVRCFPNHPRSYGSDGRVLYPEQHLQSSNSFITTEWEEELDGPERIRGHYKCGRVSSFFFPVADNQLVTLRIVTW